MFCRFFLFFFFCCCWALLKHRSLLYEVGGGHGRSATGRSCSVSGKVERLLGRLKVAIVVVGRHLNLPTVNLILRRGKLVLLLLVLLLVLLAKRFRARAGLTDLGLQRVAAAVIDRLGHVHERDGGVGCRFRRIVLRFLGRRGRLVGRLLRCLKVDAGRIQLLLQRLDALLGRTDHLRLGGELGRRLASALLCVFRRHLRIVQGGLEHLHVVERLLGCVLGRLGRSFRLLQLLDLGIERLVRLEALLLQPLQQHVLPGEGGLGRGGRLGSRLGERVLRHVRSLLGCGMLVSDGRVGLIGGTLGDRAEPTAGTVARFR